MALSIERPASFRLAVLACVTAAVLSGCGGGTGGAPGAPAGAERAPGARGGGAAGGRGGRGGPSGGRSRHEDPAMSVQRMVDLAGTLMSPDQARVSAEAAGVVRAVLVEIGQEVSRTPLVKLEPRELQLALARAESALKQTRAQLGMHGPLEEATTRRPTTRWRRSAMPTRRTSTPRRPPSASTRGRPRHRVAVRPAGGRDQAEGGRGRLPVGHRYDARPEALLRIAARPTTWR